MTSTCDATTRSGTSCRRPAGWGTPHPGIGTCKLHGGSTPTHVVAAAKISAEAEAQRMVARAGVDADPLEHLLESLHRAAALVEVWGAMVAAIDQGAEDEAAERGTLRGELGYDLNRDERSHDELNVVSRDRMLGLNRHGEAAVHPYVTEYQNALERRAKFAKLCIDAGIAERQVKLAEEQGKLIAKMIGEILDDVGVKRTRKVNEIVGRRLRLVEQA